MSPCWTWTVPLLFLNTRSQCSYCVTLRHKQLIYCVSYSLWLGLTCIFFLLLEMDHFSCYLCDKSIIVGLVYFLWLKSRYFAMAALHAIWNVNVHRVLWEIHLFMWCEWDWEMVATWREDRLPEDQYRRGPGVLRVQQLKLYRSLMLVLAWTDAAQQRACL
jgi:hypothetical protein